MPTIKTTRSIRMENENLILTEILRSQGISRVALAKKLHMTKGGITPIVSRLLDIGIIEESQTATSTTASGRKPILLRICPNRCFAIAVDFTRTGFSVALVNLDNAFLFMDEYSFQIGEPLEHALENLRKAISDILHANQDKLIVGIVVVAPGPIDYENCTILNPPNFFNWTNIPIGSFLKEHFALDVSLFNNAEAHTLAELYFGYGREFSNFLQIIVDEGVGGGIILDHRLFRGSFGLGAEFGHISIDINGKPCECGNKGCIEMYASITNMLSSVNDTLKSAYLNGETDSFTKLNWSAFLDQLNQGNPYCIAQMEAESFYLGNLLVSLCNIFDPSAIIIGSTLSQAGDLITTPVSEFVNQHTISRKEIPILTSSLKSPSLIGASISVFEDFFRGKFGDIEEILQSSSNLHPDPQ